MSAKAAATYDTVITSVHRGKHTRKDEPGETPWRHHLWDVTLTRNGVIRDAITFEYRMGEGHEQTKCGKPKPSLGSRYAVHPMQVCSHVRCDNAGWQPTPPTLYDVLCSLKADRTDGASFREWAGDFGMDTDSIKARELYLACQESEDRSKRFFGADWSTICDDEDYE